MSSSAGPAPRPSRRCVLQLAVLAAAGAATSTLQPTAAEARKKPSKPLIASLVVLVRTRDSLGDLKTGIEDGSTNRDLVRVMRVLLKGNNISASLREAALWLPVKEAEEAEALGRDAVEYLDQTLAYYDPTAMNDKPLGEYLAFALKAIEAASKKLDGCLAFFPEGEVENARQQLTMDIPPS